jgi:hypothetical protein
MIVYPIQIKFCTLQCCKIIYSDDHIAIAGVLNVRIAVLVLHNLMNLDSKTVQLCSLLPSKQVG